MLLISSLQEENSYQADMPGMLKVKLLILWRQIHVGEQDEKQNLRGEDGTKEGG